MNGKSEFIGSFPVLELESEGRGRSKTVFIELSNPRRNIFGSFYNVPEYSRDSAVFSSGVPADFHICKTTKRTGMNP